MTDTAPAPTTAIDAPQALLARIETFWATIIDRDLFAQSMDALVARLNAALPAPIASLSIESWDNEHERCFRLDTGTLADGQTVTEDDLLTALYGHLDPEADGYPEDI
jgi:hypothetical protein